MVSYKFPLVCNFFFFWRLYVFMHKLFLGCVFTIHKNYFIVYVLKYKRALTVRRLNVFVRASTAGTEKHLTLSFR